MAAAAIPSLAPSSSSISNSNHISSQNEVTDEMEKNHKKIASNDVSSSLLTSDGTGEAVSGFLGGFFSKLLDHPLDTIKTRMQSAGSSNSTLVSTTNVAHPSSFNFMNFNHSKQNHYESSNVARCNATNSQFQHHFQRHQQQNDFRISKKFVYLHPSTKQNSLHPAHHEQQQHHNNNNKRQCINETNLPSNDHHHHHRPITARSCIRQIYHHDGFFGFYSGISSPLWGTALVKSLRFSIYGRVQNSMSSLYFPHDDDDQDDATATNKNMKSSKKKRDNHQDDDSQLLLPLSLIALAGGIAGGACCVVVTPMEVTKVRCQADPRQYPGVLSCVYQTLFPSNSSVVSSSATSLNNTNNNHNVNSNLFHHSNHHHPRQPMESTKRSTNFSFSNIKGLYSGFTATFLKESVGYAWWFYVYEKTLRCLTTYHQHSSSSSLSSSSSSSATFHFAKNSNHEQQQKHVFALNTNEKNPSSSPESLHLHQNNKIIITRDSLPFIDFIVAGAVSSLFFWTVFYPIDTVKTIMQTDPLRKMIYDPSTGRRSLKNLNFSETLRELWIRDPKILFRGLGVTLVRAVPSNGVTMFFYEATKKFWKEKIQKKETMHREMAVK